MTRKSDTIRDELQKKWAVTICNKICTYSEHSKIFSTSLACRSGKPSGLIVIQPTLWIRSLYELLHSAILIQRLLEHEIGPVRQTRTCYETATYSIRHLQSICLSVGYLRLHDSICPRLRLAGNGPNVASQRSDRHVSADDAHWDPFPDGASRE